MSKIAANKAERARLMNLWDEQLQAGETVDAAATKVLIDANYQELVTLTANHKGTRNIARGNLNRGHS